MKVRDQSNARGRATGSMAYVPFPTQLLPEPLRSFVSASAKAIGCDDAFVALPVLTACASAIGNSRRLRLKDSWSEPAILWTAIVGESGSMKSPALDHAMAVVHDLQKAALLAYDEALKEFEVEMLLYEKILGEWKKKGESGPPNRPQEPIARRFYCSDTTVEALAMILVQTPRGLMLQRDELSGWFGSFDQYKGGKGGDTAHWLEMHGGRSMTVDRKTGAKRVIHVPRAALSIAGGIQPGILKRCLNREHLEDGLAARMLFAAPPRKVKQWTEADVSGELRAALRVVVEALYALEPATTEAGAPEPILVNLTPEAKRDWIVFYNEHAHEQVDLTGDLSAAWSKLEGYAARLALVLHLVRRANGDARVGEQVDLESMRAAIALVRWFGNEDRRIYAMLSEDEGGLEAENARHVERIAQHGGRVTVREWQRMRKLKTSKDAQDELDDLVEDEFGRWEQMAGKPKGGPGKREFVLHPPSGTEPSDSGDRTLRGVGADGVVSPVTVSPGPSGGDQPEGATSLVEDLRGCPRPTPSECGGFPVDSSDPLERSEIQNPIPGEDRGGDTVTVDTSPVAPTLEGVSSPGEADLSLTWGAV